MASSALSTRKTKEVDILTNYTSIGIIIIDKTMEKNNQDIDRCDLNSRFEKIKASDEKINKKNFCHNCQVETFQKKVFEHIDIITPEVIPFNEDGRRGESVWTIGGIIWRITECNGCGKMNFNVYRRNSVLEELVLEHQYPTKGFRPIPAWVTYLKKDYIELETV